MFQAHFGMGEKIRKWMIKAMKWLQKLIKREEINKVEINWSQRGEDGIGCRLDE